MDGRMWYGALSGSQLIDKNKLEDGYLTNLLFIVVFLMMPPSEPQPFSQ